MTACTSLSRAELLFRSVELPDVPTGVPDLRDYYTAASWPAREAGDNHLAAGDAFAEHTYAVKWQCATRRGLRPGDMLRFNGALYMFADEAQATEHARKGRPAARLARFLHLWLVDFSLELRHERNQS